MYKDVSGGITAYPRICVTRGLSYCTAYRATKFYTILHKLVCATLPACHVSTSF